MIGRIFGGLISGVVGFSLIPTINQQVDLAMAGQNATSTAAITINQMLSFTPYIFGLAILTTIFMSFVPDLFPSDEYQEEYKAEPNRKQTYEEFVRERLKVERMMRWGWIGRYI